MIKIREDFRLFTHLPGKESIIPGAKAWMKAFPCLMEIYTEGQVFNIKFMLENISGFTHLLNIEKRRVEVFKKAKEGYFHLFVFARNGEIILKLHRGKNLRILIDGKNEILNLKDELSICKTLTKDQNKKRERVSFGCYKKPMLEKNIDLDTKLYLLSQDMPDTDLVDLDSVQIKSLMYDLCAPKAEDINHRGLKLPLNPFDRFALFATFKKQFRDALFLENEESVFLLKEGRRFPIAGRANGLQGDGFLMDLLWKKGKVQRAIIYPSKNCSKTFIFPKQAKRYRIKSHLKERGKFIESLSSLELEADKKVYIDRIVY
ncbi:MAG: hypothetical protein S4CHLAM20_09520 [Chlamydiia bacterium]|nr:hypothetical protein [Chlamydiia bacterium]